MKGKFIVLYIILILIMMAGRVNATYISELGDGLKDREQKDALDIANFIESLNDEFGEPYNLGTEGLNFLSKIEVDSGVSSDGYSIDSTGSSGQWFSPDGADVDFIIVKAGNDNQNSEGGYSIFVADNNFWDTAKLNDHNISHISFWSAPDFDPPSNPPGGGAQVPEPATIFLLGSGLLGLFGYRKKFWKPKN